MTDTPHWETFRVDRSHPGVALVTLDRPDRYDAMTDVTFRELPALCAQLDGADDVRVVVLTGAGKAFCAGYDLDLADELTSLGALGMLDKQERAARAMVAVRSLRVPVIAAVNGPAAGGGMSLALAASARLVGAEEAVAIGLANRVVPSEALIDEALAMARTIAARRRCGWRRPRSSAAARCRRTPLRSSSRAGPPSHSRSTGESAMTGAL